VDVTGLLAVPAILAVAVVFGWLLRPLGPRWRE